MSEGVEAVRLDRWLHVARAYKTRSQATRACSLGRVQVNGAKAKAHRALRVGDRVEIDLRDWQRVLVVRKLADKPLPKPLVPELYDDQSPPRPERDPSTRALTAPPARRERGAGRPTKRDRREIERLRG
ncbi:MAG TPA: S4 domain-containing protein [Thermoanaerobaculia bacterium]|nr:S4 domain-containing protein [Thermoanaerobaculia bacterium]